ncbi:hypothetical protein FRC16_007888 [Serendipita sp. 398]|nr:hypothetical protein FRC16_007888 [Serendipita sp. 398]
MKALFRKNQKKKQKKATESSHQVSTEPVEPHPLPSTSTSITTQQAAPHPQPSKPHEDASELSEQFFSIVKEISEATDLLSPLKSACALMIRGIQAMRAAHGNTVAWIELCEQLEHHLVQLEAHRSELQKIPSIKNDGCLKALEYYFSVITEVIKNASWAISGEESKIISSIKHSSVAQTEKEEMGRYQTMMENAWQAYSIEMKRLITLKVKEVGDQLEEYEKAHTRATPGQLPEDGVVGPDSKIAYGDRIDLCEEGTRVEVLDAIRTWATDYESNSQIFWLNDAAGTGKSTIAATIANEWSLNNRLAGRFFFSPNSRITQTTKEFCRLVSNDIAKNQPSLTKTIQDEIQLVLSEEHVWFEVQLQRLIIDPVRTLEDGRVFIVVDALDNCVLSEERRGLLNAFIQHLPSAPRLKLLLTSRPVQDISDVLTLSPLVHGSDLQLLNVRHSYHRDIHIFVDKRLSNIPKISYEHRKMIIEKSGGLFLYAATVCRMLEKGRHRLDTLKIISDIGSTDKLERRMDILYLSVLKQALIDKDAGDMMMSVLSMIIAAYQPISSNTISRFLPNNTYVEDFVQDLGGVLKDGHPDRPIKVLHPTFREFILSDEDRANGFLLHPAQSAAAMAYACISTLEHMLGDGLFQLDKPDRLLARNDDIEGVDRLIQKSTTAAERYASAFWAHHVAASDMSPDLWSRVTKLLSQKYLNWVELMSWRGSIGLCIEGLSRLRRISNNQINSNRDSQDSLIVRHAHQFVVQHQSIIIESALQTYCMALFFTPRDSPLFMGYRERYRDRQPKIMTPSSVEWESHIALGGHSSIVYQLIFSPDGSRLISIDQEGILQLWNTETGSLAGKPFRGGKKSDIPVTGGCKFSVDGQQFGFWNDPSGLHIRYSYNGEPVFPPLPWPAAWPFTFSSTLSHFIGAKDSSITQWDIKHGMEAQKTRHAGAGFKCDEVAISPDDGMIVIVGCHEEEKITRGQILLWRLSTFQQVASCELPRVPHYPLDYVGTSFSPDSGRFAIGIIHGTESIPGTAILYDAKTGKEIEVMQGVHLRARWTPVVFCPLSRYLAHNSWKFSIVIREQKTGETISTLYGHKDSIIHLSFSPDSKRLASVSSDQTLRVWNVETGEALNTILSGYTGIVRYCALSLDWDHFASTAPLHPIRLYDMRGGASGRDSAEPANNGGMGDYAIIGAAYMDSIVAIRSQTDAGAMLWDTSTGTNRVHTLPTRDYVVSVAFSPNGEMIAAVLSAPILRIWDAKTFAYTKDFEVGITRHRDGGVFFSPDSTLIGAYHTASATVWDVKTEQIMLLYSSSALYDYDFVKLCAISSDNSRATGVDHRSLVLVWDLDPITNRSVQVTLSKHRSEPSAAFSPTDPSLLAVTLLPDIMLWRVAEELQLIMKIEAPKGLYGKLSFSYDGQYLAYGPLVWDVSTTSPVLYAEDLPPTSFNAIGLQAHSFLFYKDGWICSAFPQGSLLPVPSELRGLEMTRHWYAFGEKVIFMNQFGEPILVDLSSILAQARQ